MRGGGAALEFCFSGPPESRAPHFYLYDAAGNSMDLEPSFASFSADAGQILLNAREVGDTGFTLRKGEKLLFHAPQPE